AALPIYQISRQAAEEGLDYDFDAIVVANSFIAHRFLHFARAHGLMPEAKEALLSRHFEKGRDIGDIAYLAEVGTSLGLDAAQISRVLDSEEITAEDRADSSKARALGATGVPFFVIDRRYAISGAQPTAVFAEALETAWSENQKIAVLAGGGSDDSRESGEGAVCGPDGCD